VSSFRRMGGPCRHRHCADSSRGRYPPVQYFPREDVDMSLLEPSDHQTYCPYKGDCSYSASQMATRNGERCLELRDALPAVSSIAGYLAFYQDRVDFFRG